MRHYVQCQCGNMPTVYCLSLFEILHVRGTGKTVKGEGGRPTWEELEITQPWSLPKPIQLRIATSI